MSLLFQYLSLRFVGSTIVHVRRDLYSTKSVLKTYCPLEDQQKENITEI